MESIIKLHCKNTNNLIESFSKNIKFSDSEYLNYNLPHSLMTSKTGIRISLNTDELDRIKAVAREHGLKPTAFLKFLFYKEINSSLKEIHS